MYNILVVDDSAVDRKLLSGLITRDNRFQVVEAESGSQALNRLAEWDVDLVVTDLQMPGIDGLELVKWIRQQHSDIPTILATGQGSEEVASRALRLGAAGYVPKSRLSELLVTTIVEVLDLMYSDRVCEKVFDYASESAFSFDLGIDPDKIPPVINLCERLISSCVKIDRIERLRICVAIEQALHNAIYRGNLEIDSSHSIPFGNEDPSDELANLLEERASDEVMQERRTKLSLHLNREGLRCRIIDDGSGFEEMTESADVDVDETSRGIVLMRAFMDKVVFNDSGNEVNMIRRWASSKQHSKSDSAKASASEQEALKNENEVEHPAVESEVDTATGETATASGGASVATVPTTSTEKLAASSKELGRLIPVDGSEEIPLTADRQLIGRSKTCHIVLAHRAVSSHHCQLLVIEGWWCVKDMKSSNGVTINGNQAAKGRLMPGDELGVGKLKFTIEYDPTELGAVGITPPAI